MRRLALYFITAVVLVAATIALTRYALHLHEFWVGLLAGATASFVCDLFYRRGDAANA
jgi:hypothetical protein